MTQVRINPQAFFPMPVALLGALVDGKVNFMTEAWICRANYEPPLIAVAVNKGHHTSQGILENREFSLCFPAQELLLKTDYCGLVSGKEVDKSQLFDVFYGDLRAAPLITDCQLNFACRLTHQVEYATNNLFIGEIVEVFALSDRMNGTRPDFEAMDLFLLTLPDNTYWGMGPAIGRAWMDGKAFAPVPE
ncbi:flavoredoxin [Geobacter sp. OR-1]|uniref:flavin reductase family protein n=1 Tax=Geobacter sp. OR-1 TaxID=1266765 RepID=UPI00054396C5|nr:flavin reductase family protein [Geobacter sp. OR-1]GAM09225.1 flavoredoxin [Geobacter sp. OR-1]